MIIKTNNKDRQIRNQYFTSVHNGQNNFERNLIIEGIAVFINQLHNPKNREKKLGMTNLKSLT